MEFVEVQIADEVTPTAVTEPPDGRVDVESQRRRFLRTRTGTGLGESTRIPVAPIPTAAPTAVPTTTRFTIQEAMPTPYSSAVRECWRRSVRAAAARAATATR